MLKWWGGALLIVAVFYAKAEANDFFVVPEKSLRFIDQKTKKQIQVSSYSLYYETRFDCQDSACKKFRGNSTSTTEVSGGVDSFKTLLTRIPRMPNSGPLTLTFSVPGICGKTEKCTASISYDDFLQSAEPVIFYFTYDESASKILRKKRQQAEAQLLTEIEEKLGQTRTVSSFAGTDAWKKFGEDFIENRKKLNPMSYGAGSVAKLGLETWKCGKSLQEKISSCEVHACIYSTDILSDGSAEDLIVHGYNTAGNCAISAPGGKRFFIPKAELPSFYDAFTANWVSGVKLTDPCADSTGATACRDKKTDLLFQLNNRHLVTDFVPVRIGQGNEK